MSDKKVVGINIDEELLSKIDDEAEKKYTSRSSIINYAIAIYLDND